MAARRKQRSFPAFLSVLGHAALVALLFYGVPLARTERTAISDGNPVNTIMVSEIPYVAERQRIEVEAEQQAARDREAAEARRKAQEAEEQAAREALQEQQRIAAEEAAAEAEAQRLKLQREAEAEQKRIDDARIAEERAAEEQRQREEAERLAAEEEQKRQEELARQQAEEERKRLEAEAALQRQRDQIAAEIAARATEEAQDREARESGVLDQWIRAIEARVTQNWIEPPNRSPDLDCMLDVNLQPDGTVTDVRISQCRNADDNVKRSLDNAVRQSSPLPRRPAGIAYQPSLSIRFRPND